MNITDIFKSGKPSISFEFFPPKSDAASKRLFDTISHLMPLKPRYVSVTYGADGSTRHLTHDLVVRIRKETDLTVVPHLTCVGESKDQIYEMLECYDKAGIKNIMALRGDPPRDEEKFTPVPDGFEHAVDLVAFIRGNFPKMGIGVAGFPEGHPECPNRLKEMEYLKRKVDAGADYICTQLFFDNRDFYDFRERCQLSGIDIPIVAGIMPVTSRKNIERMADLALGARYPAKLLKAVERAGDDDKAVERVGIHWATEQVMDLMDNGVCGVHFFTLNRSEAAVQIYRSLGIKDSDSFHKQV